MTVTPQTPDREPRTAKATDAVVRRGQETKATALRDAGWLVIPPERAAEWTEHHGADEPDDNPIITRAERAVRALGVTTREEAARALAMWAYVAEMTEREREELLRRFAPKEQR